jgi:hypothetical protein
MTCAAQQQKLLLDSQELRPGESSAVHHSSGAYRATGPDVAYPQENPYFAALTCREEKGKCSSNRNHLHIDNLNAAEQKIIEINGNVLLAQCTIALQGET